MVWYSIRKFLSSSLASLLLSLLGMSLLCLGHSSNAAAAGAPVRMSETLDADGAPLYLLTRGEDSTAPVLLWLHGGPGGAERPLFRYYNGSLEQDFIVAYWDQRGAGRSFDADANPDRLTIERHLADLDLVVDHLRKTLQKDKIILLGHSWGGALALLYASRHPEKVRAVAGVAPLINQALSETHQYRFVLSKATSGHDAAVKRKLDELGPPPWPSAKTAMQVERLADKYGAIFHQRPAQLYVLVAATFRGLVLPWKIPALIRGNNVSLEAMHDELATLDLGKSVTSLKVPVFFLLGRYDHHVDSQIAAAYFKRLQKPAGHIIWFEQSAHNIPFEQPKKFNQVIRSLFTRSPGQDASEPPAS